MLPKKRKIPRNEFPKDLRSGVFYYSPHITGIVFKGDPNIPSLFSCVVSKKYVNGAVKRVLIKRTVYKIIQTYDKKIFFGNKIIFLMKKGIHTVSQEDLTEEIITILRKANLINTTI